MKVPIFTIGHSTRPTPEFERGLQRSVSTADRAVAIMCAEAPPRRCHRSLVADALTARGVAARHIFDARKVEAHQLTPFARVEGRLVRYPLAG